MALWIGPTLDRPVAFSLSTKTKRTGTGVKERSRVKQFERIRRDAREKAVSVSDLARVHGVHRRTVRAALADSTPPPRKAPVRVALAVGPRLENIRAWLVADLDAPRKQRHTARRVWQGLVDEHGATAAESTVTHAVAKIRRELISRPVNVAVPQTHAPGG
jgi:hypothetical protein